MSFPLKIAVLAGCLLFSALSFGQENQECRVLVGKEWIQMGATTLSGCLKFADEAASPGERQFAKHGETFLKVQGGQHQQSPDGGNTWYEVAGSAPVAGFQSLNVLEAPQGESAALATEGSSKSASKPVKKKKRRYRYHR